MRLPRWALSRRDERSHIVDDDVRHAFALVARCGHEINVETGTDTERALYMVPRASCAAVLVLELLRELDVSEAEAWAWLAAWRHG